MSIWLAGLLALLIVVGGLVVLPLIVTSIVWLVKAGTPTVIEVLFGMFVALCALGVLVGLWYIALFWLMGWPL